MNISRIATRIALVVPCLVTAAACSSADDSDVSENVGSATLQIAVVPAQTQCIEVDASNSARSVERRLDVTPGASAVFTLKQLPTGSVKFNGFAYALPCNQVNPSSVPTWQTEDTLATLSGGASTPVTLTFRPNGVADVTADFVGDGVNCAPGEQICGGTCVNVSTDANNCGACGSVCSGGASCQNGVCVSSCPGGQALCNGACTDLSSDSQNCGACGLQCPPFNTFCSAGACVPGREFKASFTQGQPAGPQTCSNWNQFRSSLGGPVFNRVRLERIGGATVLCQQPNVANQLCNALRNGAPIAQIPCDGRMWTVSNCQGGVSIAVDAPGGNACDCAASSALKPCSLGPDWGGVLTPVCGGPSQTIAIRCEQ